MMAGALVVVQQKLDGLPDIEKNIPTVKSGVV
jgi:hypothetical protein